MHQSCLLKQDNHFPEWWFVVVDCVIRDIAKESILGSLFSEELYSFTRIRAQHNTMSSGPPPPYSIFLCIIYFHSNFMCRLQLLLFVLIWVSSSTWHNVLRFNFKQLLLYCTVESNLHQINSYITFLLVAFVFFFQLLMVYLIVNLHLP